jgi:hypothetical protein
VSEAVRRVMPAFYKVMTDFDISTSDAIGTTVELIIFVPLAMFTFALCYELIAQLWRELREK